MLPCRRRDADAVEAAAARIEEELGPDRRVGQLRDGDGLRARLGDDGRRVPARHRGHLPGRVNGTLAALRRMRPRDRGVIVQVGSALAYRAIPLQAAYCGAKFAMRGFTDALRTELLHDGSGVRSRWCSCPALNTPQFDAGAHRAAQAAAAGRRRSASPRWPPTRSCSPPSTRAARSGWATTPRRDHRRERVAPWVGDRYLARTNIEAQQSATCRPTPNGRTTSTRRCPAIAAAHGPFDGEARASSVQLSLAKRRRALTLAAAATAVGAARTALVRRAR